MWIFIPFCNNEDDYSYNSLDALDIYQYLSIFLSNCLFYHFNIAESVEVNGINQLRQQIN